MQRLAVNFLLKQGSWDTESRDAALRTTVVTVVQRLVSYCWMTALQSLRERSNLEVFADNIMDGASENGNVGNYADVSPSGYPVNGNYTAWYAMKNAARTGQTAALSNTAHLDTIRPSCR